MNTVFSQVLQNVAKRVRSGFESYWIPRKDVKPRVCPKCKSPYWGTEKRRT